MAETGMAGPVLLRVGQMFDGDCAVAPLADAGIVVGGMQRERGGLAGMDADAGDGNLLTQRRLFSAFHQPLVRLPA